MTTNRTLWFWGLLSLLTLAVIWGLRDMLLPFILGLGIAYFLDPITDRVQKWGLPRSISAAVVLLSFVGVLVVVVALSWPVLSDQFVRFLNAVPNYIERIRTLIGPYLQMAQEQLALISSSGDLQQQTAGLTNKALGLSAGLLKGVWAGGSALFNIIGILLITPVVAFYMLRDWDRMTNKVDSWLPREHADTIRSLFKQIDAAISGFVRGQALVCLLLGLIYGVCLSIMGLEFGFFIGVMAGVLSFIPYAGSIAGFIAAILVAWFQYGDWTHLLIVCGIFGFGQAIESNILTPKLVGDKVGLHAVWVLFALMAGASLMGFVGVMIAVPVAAVIGVMVRFSLEQYLASPYYMDKNKKRKTAGD